MNTIEIREHLLSRAPWVDRKSTVDTVKIGDPLRPVRKAGVGWMATIYDLEAAHEAGCDLFITHEPTFNDHMDPVDGACRSEEPGKSKRHFLERTGMVVLRCHDAWDSWPGIGIRDSWARGLGLTELVAENRDAEAERGWHAVYAIAPTTLEGFARQVADRVRPLGQDGVEILGDSAMTVSRPAIGVGCGGPDKDMIDQGADALVVCYDGDWYWRDRERFVELGAGVLMVEHGTAEMWGMENLASYLAEAFPGLQVQYFARHPRARHVP
jgi:putative NIF3 family GTP cyclohydrolase 1 type 2